MKYLLIITLFLLTISCSKDDYNLTPSGVLALENRVITSSFSKIEASDGFTINMFQNGDSTMLVEADDNILQYVETYVLNGILMLKIKDGVRIASGIINKTVNISLPVDKLNSIIATGGSRILFSSSLNQDTLIINTSGGGSILGSVKCYKMALSISGGGSANLKGNCETLNCNLSGGGFLHLFELTTDDVKIDISGGSTAELFVNKSINIASASGGSKIYYKGMAQVVESNITGGSIVVRVI